MAKKSSQADRIEQRTCEIGRELHERLSRRSPSIFHTRWWEDRLMAWALNDDSIKIQLFRFIDVLPVLRDHVAIARHLEDYFEEVRLRLPKAARLGLDLSLNNSILSRALAFNVRSNAFRMAKRFVLAGTHEEALLGIRRLRRSGFATELQMVRSDVLSHREADQFRDAHVSLISELLSQMNEWPDDEVLDLNSQGQIPRLHVSLRLSSLDGHVSPVDYVGTRDRILSRFRPILRAAKEQQGFLQIAAEHCELRQMMFAILKSVLSEPEFLDFTDIGITIEAYNLSAEEDLKSWIAWVRDRGHGIGIRLMTGSTWDHERVVSARNRWEDRVTSGLSEASQNFEQLAEELLRHSDIIRPLFYVHDIRSLSYVLAWREVLSVPERDLEFQLMHGVSEEFAQLFRERDYRVRISAPYGPSVLTLSSLARGFLENPSNDGFLRGIFSELPEPESILMKPSKRVQTELKAAEQTQQEFVNEPLTDFGNPESREAMIQAISQVRDEFGQEYPLVIDGKSCDSRATIVSRNPSKTSEIIGRVASASIEQASDAIDAARRAFGTWSNTPPETRADYLELVAAEMRERRFELCAWIILECGKPWAEADLEVAESIDFCMYYAAEMRRLGVPRRSDVPGEENFYSYKPRGVSVVISPWNSPLAVLTGMTAASLVAGNTVIMKPAEQASVVASRFMHIIRNSHLPDGVVNYVPGSGPDVGPVLVGSPDVDLVVFTGSQSVGLEINRCAADTDHRQRNVRRVIADMGGKNAIIVDDDADLDQAVTGVIKSTFGYSGQKCSSCSRVIVMDGIYDQFVERLTEAVKGLKIGAADDPATVIGPVIDEEAKGVILEHIRKVDPESDGILAVSLDPGPLAKQGTYVGPHVFVNVDPASNLAQNEVFGPVLAVIRAKSLDHAFEYANGTRYALAGGVYSRSPSTLRRARNEFEVGTLYLNRDLSGTMVSRQPFGGYRMSGTGNKPGGPDYLLQFMIPVSVSENITRRGEPTKK
ncbi:MAG: proline dehydrogenase family protein [Planctomyces sp.]|nr:proline dehydrogenase family protein [Planctomyces sp.]